jgi:hypothetical protein
MQEIGRKLHFPADDLPHNRGGKNPQSPGTTNRLKVATTAFMTG